MLWDDVIVVVVCRWRGMVELAVRLRNGRAGSKMREDKEEDRGILVQQMKHN